MTVSAVAIPTPPNSNMDRAMFVWVGTAGSAGDPLSSDTKMNSLLTWCTNHGVNVLFLDMWGYLGGGNFSTTHAQTFQKFIHYAHASGIRVMALCGNNDWGHNQQWVATNIIKNLAQYQAYCTNNTTYPMGTFDGVILDVEYWSLTGGYTVTEPVGLCDLMLAMKKVLNLPVGCCPTQWLADPLSAALSFSYNGGPTQLEGLNLMDCADFLAVQTYFNTSAQQISQFQNWFNYASATGEADNIGLWCVSLTDSGFGTSSYWTGSSGAIATMETAHTAISAQFTASPNTNMSFRGQAIEQYSSYDQMT